MSTHKHIRQVLLGPPALSGLALLLSSLNRRPDLLPGRGLMDGEDSRTSTLLRSHQTRTSSVSPFGVRLPPFPGSPVLDRSGK